MSTYNNFSFIRQTHKQQSLLKKKGGGEREKEKNTTIIKSLKILNT